MLCRIIPKKRRTGAVPVYLNVYDLTPINGYAYWLGLGVYHSGVQVHGVEYGFGAHDRETTGIYEVEPKQCPGFTFRKSILAGRTDLGPKEVHSLMEKLSKQYLGNMYHLISKNCNHFCNDVCNQLTGNSIPRWVNRLARFGLLCKCVLPAGLNETKVRHIKLQEEDSVADKNKTGSNSNRSNSTNPSSTPPSLSASSSNPASQSRRQRRCVPPSPLPPLCSSSKSAENT